MEKFADVIYVGFEYAVKSVRVPIFGAAFVTRVKSVYFCRYSCISDNISS